MKRSGLSAVFITWRSTALSAPVAGCPGSIGTTPTSVGGAVAFSTKGLAVDADGAPNSYLVDGNGLSHTCDGVVAIVNGKRATPDAAAWNHDIQKVGAATFDAWGGMERLKACTP